jgi:hypothetical protein
MPAMLSKLYHALLGAGVDDATATAAAEEAAVGDARFADLRLDIEKRFGEVEHRFSELHLNMETRFGDMEKRFAEVRVDVAQLRGEMRVLVWQTRLTLGGVVGLVLYALKQVLGL